MKARKPEIVKEETVIDNSEIKALPSTITFPFNSSKIELSQEVSIFNIAEFLKANPEIRVRLTISGLRAFSSAISACCAAFSFFKVA